MEIYWTRKAQGDLERIYRFSLQYHRPRANIVLDRLMKGALELGLHPEMGKLQTRYERRQVRKMLFDDYEVHYEIKNNHIFILDLWHTKEER